MKKNNFSFNFNRPQNISYAKIIIVNYFIEYLDKSSKISSKFKDFERGDAFSILLLFTSKSVGEEVRAMLSRFRDLAFFNIIKVFIYPVLRIIVYKSH